MLSDQPNKRSVAGLVPLHVWFEELDNWYSVVNAVLTVPFNIAVQIKDGTKNLEETSCNL